MTADSSGLLLTDDIQLLLRHRVSITVAVSRFVAALPLSVMWCSLLLVTCCYPLSVADCRGCLDVPGTVVVPAGGGLVASPSQRPAQDEREPGAGDQPGGGLPGQCGEPGGLGD
jgi:hypothetical protein